MIKKNYIMLFELFVLYEINKKILIIYLIILSPKGLFRDNETNRKKYKFQIVHNVVKNPSWHWRQTSWLLTSVAEGLNFGLSRNNSS